MSISQNSNDTTDRILWTIAYFLGTDNAKITKIMVDGTSIPLLQANTARKALSIYNDSSHALLIFMAQTASLATAFQSIGANSSMIMTVPVYRGIISAIHTGNNPALDPVIVTEFT